MTRRVQLKIGKLIVRGVDARDQRAVAAGIARELVERPEISAARGAGSLPRGFANECAGSIAQQVAKGARR